MLLSFIDLVTTHIFSVLTWATHKVITFSLTFFLFMSLTVILLTTFLLSLDWACLWSVRMSPLRPFYWLNLYSPNPVYFTPLICLFSMSTAVLVVVGYLNSLSSYFLSCVVGWFLFIHICVDVVFLMFKAILLDWVIFLLIHRFYMFTIISLLIIITSFTL